MKKLFAFIFLVSLIIPFSLLAQNPNDQMVKEWERAKAYTKEYMDAMPDDGYSLKPTKEMRSFAQQMLHIADANYGLGSMALGLTSPAKFGELEKATDQSKATTEKTVMDSYDFIINGLKSVAADKMMETVNVFNNNISRHLAVMKTFEHQTHHRGQTTVYLRLKGVTPPQERLF
jgi:uncharacterized damage-inducible protein DinB